MNAVEVRDLAKVYRAPLWRGGRRIEALRGVSLSAPEGRIFGLLGPNGAGKSTLVKILLGIARPTSGEALLVGRPPRWPESRRTAGYQPEDARLPDYHTAETFLRYQGGLAGLGGRALSVRIEAVLERVGLSRWRGEKIRKFSKGMRQRLTLAQAILAEPRVLFLDEPTDGLDPIGRIEVRDLLLDLKRQGVTIFINSHLLSEVETVCDRVAILRRGEVAASGTIPELTLQACAYRLAVTRWDPAWGEGLAPLVASFAPPEDGVLVVRLDDEARLDAVVDYLRARGAGIRELTRSRATLEEVFVSLVQERGGAVGSLRERS